MDACHILLGRPWQYDRKTKHDGYQNTYSFYKDGVNVTLVPLDTRKPTDVDPNLFMSRTEIIEAVKTNPLIFTLVIEQANKVGHHIPVEVKGLLHEFSDVLLDDIPLGLPLMRDVQHCIDFVLGSTIPNKPAYRMNPSEFAEL
ncbi:uncharacterized protein [Rutidosis leptorrhynchoides]|uniref:uncharacterized protein n=1 Tax=Rutidosis leptorrhynchoides TaxID=125765 RepID=UPI003A993682